MKSDENIKNSIINNYEGIIKRIGEIYNTDISILSKLYTYNDFNSVFPNISEEEYHRLDELIKSININKIKDKLESIKNICIDFKNKCNSNWNNYNDSYKRYVDNRLMNINKVLHENVFSNINLNYIKKDINIVNVRNYFMRYYDSYNTLMNIDTKVEVLDYFSYINKNYIIFGKNGSGKTRLLNYIKNNYFNNAFVIPSDKVIKCGRMNHIRMDYSQIYNLHNIFDNGNFPNDLLTLFFKDLCISEQQKESNTIRENGNIYAKSYYKLIEIFNSLGLNRKIKFDMIKNTFFLYNDELGIDEYLVDEASDGEKSIIMFITFILLCPKDSFLFIDEPESHFNTALLNELFNILESERKDIVFIYCTHNVDFIELRNNCKYIYLDSFDGKTWNIKELDNFEDISLENIINIIGTKKNLLFIESKDDKTDFRLYNSLFSNYKIIPVESCDKVINNCKLINDSNYLNLNRTAKGIIDNDFRSNEEIDKYRKNGIFTLTYNEIENLLLSSTIVDYICNTYNLNNKLDKFKEEIIKMAVKGKNGIVQDYINKVRNKIYKNARLEYNGDINILKDEVNKLDKDNLEVFLKYLAKFCTCLDNDLKNKDYDEIIKKYPNKGFISCIKTYLDIGIENYKNWVYVAIKKEKEFKNKILNEIFQGYFK